MRFLVGTAGLALIGTLLSFCAAPAWADEGWWGAPTTTSKGYGWIDGGTKEGIWPPGDREDGLISTNGMVPLVRACLPREKAIAQLATNSGEVVRGLGTNHSGTAVFELLVSVWNRPARTWTILMTTTNGLSYIAASGKNWVDIEPQSLDPLA